MERKQDAMGDYFDAAFRTKLLVKMPEREDKFVSPATRLLEKRREANDVENALAAHKEEFAMTMEGLTQRRHEISLKEKTLTSNLKQFDRFLRENDAKYRRAVNKAADEREAIKNKEADMERLKLETVALQDECDRYKLRLQKYQQYRDFVDTVLGKSSDEFGEPRDLMRRHAMLMAAHDDLLARDQETREELQHEKDEFKKVTVEQKNEALYLNNVVAKLQARLDKVSSERHNWERQWAEIETKASEGHLELARTKISMHNLDILRDEKAEKLRRVGTAKKEESGRTSRLDSAKKSTASIDFDVTQNYVDQIDRVGKFIKGLEWIVQDAPKRDSETGDYRLDQVLAAN